MTQVLCISGSPRPSGNTESMISEFHRGVISANGKSTLIKLSEIDLKPCDGCDGCNTTRTCHIKDDLQGIYPLLEKAQVWVFASPVYWWNISGLLKNFIDRFEVYWGNEEFKRLCMDKKAVILTCGGQPETKNREAEQYLELFCTKLHVTVIGKIRASADSKNAISAQKLESCFELGKKIGSELK